MSETYKKAVEAFSKGHASEAIPLLREVLAQNDRHAAAWSFLGFSLSVSDEHDADGIAELNHAIDLEPDNALLHYHLGLVRLRRKENGPARTSLQRSTELAPRELTPKLAYADALMLSGDTLHAVSLLEELAEKAKTPAILQKLTTSRAHAGDIKRVADDLKAFRNNEALSLDQGLAILRLYMNAHAREDALSLADSLMDRHDTDANLILIRAYLADWQGDPDHMKRILSDGYRKSEHPSILARLIELDPKPDRAYLAKARLMASDDTLDPGIRCTLRFALAREADRKGNFSAAWQQVKAANRPPQGGTGFSVETLEAQLDRALSLYETRAGLTNDTTAGPGMIYMLGPARSGAVLLESILAASGQAIALGERAILLPWLELLSGLPLSEAGTRFGESRADYERFSREVLERQFGTDKRLVDRSPHNLLYAGLLALIYPHSKFIGLRRNSREIALSTYFSNMTAAFNFSRSLDDIADYLTFQKHAMERWRDAGLTMVQHDHDALLADPAGQSRALFAALGLDWQESMLDPARRKDTTRTFAVHRCREEIKPPEKTWAERYGEFCPDIMDRLAALDEDIPAA